MKRELTITILAEDVAQNNYMFSEVCPITKALYRAGYTELQDTGCITGRLEGKKVYIDTDNPTYVGLLTKLFGMFTTLNPSSPFSLRDHTVFPPVKVISQPIPVEDFIHVLIFEF